MALARPLWSTLERCTIMARTNGTLRRFEGRAVRDSVAAGAGGMGEVYRALDSELGGDVAVKVLPAKLFRRGDRLRRFKLEAAARATMPDLRRGQRSRTPALLPTARASSTVSVGTGLACGLKGSTLLSVSKTGELAVMLGACSIWCTACTDPRRAPSARNSVNVRRLADGFVGH